MVVFENRERDEIVGNPAAPTFTALAKRYATQSRYAAVAHPSLPNYLALVSGSTQGIRSRAGRADAEDLRRGAAGPGFLGASSGLYVKRHTPFLYFRQVADDPARRTRVVPFTQLSRPTSHYGRPRTAEDAWGVPRLGLSGRARPITGIWDRR